MSMAAAPRRDRTVAFDRLIQEIPRSGSTPFLLRRPWHVVGALTVVAAIVRLVGLDAGLWVDEIYSLLDSFRPPLSTVLTVYPGDTQHPLYSVLANISHSVFGESAWSVRLPAMMFGVASVPLLYALGERVAGDREALLASGLLAVSYHHVWFSQNARGYTMLAFWALLSTYLLYRGLREGDRRLLVAYGVSIGLGVFTHLTMVFMVAAQALTALTWTFWNRSRGHSDRGSADAFVDASAEASVDGVANASSDGRASPFDALLGLGVGVVVGALLYAPIFLQVLDFFINKPSQLEGISTPTWALFEALRVLRVGLGAWIGLLVGAALFGAGALSYTRRDGLALALFVLPGAVTLVGALAARGTMYPRFYFFLIGFAFLIAVRGAVVVGGFIVRRLGGDRQDERGLATGTLLAVLMVLVSVASLRANYAAPKQDFGGALDYVEREASGSDLVATVGVTTLPYAELYGREFHEVNDPESLAALRSGGRRVWLLYTFERYIEASQAGLMNTIRAECGDARVFPGTVGGGSITVCSFTPGTASRGGTA